MPAKVVAISNMKGGVGKTTVAVALAHEFAKGVDGAQARVLLVDLDAQANASFWVLGDEKLTNLIQQGKTIDAYLEDAIVFKKNVALKNYIFPAEAPLAGRVSIIPSSPALRLVERTLIVFLSRRQRNLLEVERAVSDLFNEQLAELRKLFDVIVFDSAPGISALTEAALRSAEIVVVPTVPDFISNLGLEAFCKSVFWSPRHDDAPPQRKPWVLANMVKDTPAHQAMLKEMRAEATSADGGFHLLDLEIPDAAWIEEAASAGGDHSERFNGDTFSRLAREVMVRVQSSELA